MSSDTSGKEAGDSWRSIRDGIPGVALLFMCAVMTWVVASTVSGLNVLLLAIVVGFVLSNLTGIPPWAEPGIRSHKVVLGAAIVLMGSSLTIDVIVESGPFVVLAVGTVSTITLVLVELSSRNLFGLDDKLASLLAAGSSICGVSAIIAVAGSIQARDEHVVYAAATILLFDAVTLVVYPIIGQLLSIPDKIFGIWAGVSMFSTGPVVAAGFAHSNTAGQWATMTKLTRNALIGVIAVGYAVYYARRRIDQTDEYDGSIQLRMLWDQFPKFVVGFIAVMILASSDVFTNEQIQSLENSYNWLFVIAFVGLGTELQISKLRCAGVRPILIVLVTLCLVSGLSLGCLLIAFG